MLFNTIFSYFVALGALLGGLDYLFGGRFGLSERFRDGLNCIAPMAFNMTGILILAPAIARLLSPLIAPLCRAVNIDPAMLGSLFAIDMGGYSVASELATNESMGIFSGLIVAAMLGGVITYIIPIGFSLITNEDKEFFIKGLMLGMITVPLGAFVGGIFLGIPFKTVLRNMIPICAVAIFLIAGLMLCPERIAKGFHVFNKFLTALTVCGLMLGTLQYMANITILPGTTPILEALIIPSRIAVMLMGCLPLMKLVSKLLNRFLEPFGRLLGVNGCTLEALLLTTATAIPVFTMLRNMPPKGKTAATAWMVGTMGLFTAHVGFAMGVAPAACEPQMAAKITSGVIALVIALLIPNKAAFYRQTYGQKNLENLETV